MKTRVTVYALAARLASAVALMLPLSGASAQSGRAVPKPSPTPQAPAPKPAGAKPDFAADPGAEEYMLVFPTGREGGLRVKGSELDREVRSREAGFIEQLNKAGAQGYRLISAISMWPIAVVKLDRAQYEYAGFNTSSAFYPLTGDFQRQYAELSKQGFRLVERLVSSISMWTDEHGETITETKELFLLEREKGVGRPGRYAFVTTQPRWGWDAGLELTAQVNQQLSAGFFPSRALSKIEILLEQSDNKDEPRAGKPEVRVVTSSMWGRGFEKRVNEAGKQGYRLALVNKEIAVMYRRRDDAAPVSYVWLDAKKKDFERRLAALQARGALYRMTYPNDEGREKRLIFELREAGDGKRREYKVLKFELREGEGAADNRVNIELTPPSKEAVNLLNNLAKEGFVVRDIFLSDKVSVLLERPQ